MPKSLLLPITLHISEDIIESAIQAMRYEGRMEAGMSQAPHLIEEEQTEVWQHADKLQMALDEHRRNVRKARIIKRQEDRRNAAIQNQP